jgi:NAD(P)-dependent dehydrogenase (short-subunit alcohol dehydrogenase family)
LVESKPDMSGRVSLITGGNSGIGKHTALGLAKMGSSVVIVSRDKDKGEAALIELRRVVPRFST